jgi:hypothetical protein
MDIVQNFDSCRKMYSPSGYMLCISYPLNCNTLVSICNLRYQEFHFEIRIWYYG